MTNYLGNFRAARPISVIQGPTQQEIAQALGPLFVYFDENFAIMKQTLTDAAMIMVMTRLWKEALSTIESLLVPPLSDKLSQQRPLTQQELDIVFKWLKMLFDFFHAVDEDGNVEGVPMDVLKSPKYHELQNLNFFYFEATEDLIRTSESMAAASAKRQQEQAQRMNRMSAPPAMGHQFGGAAGFAGMPTRKHKTIMLSRNLGTMKKAKEEKRKEAQAEPNDDMILRILRMRPEAERYLKDRSRQKVCCDVSRWFAAMYLTSESRNVSPLPKQQRQLCVRASTRVVAAWAPRVGKWAKGRGGYIDSACLWGSGAGLGWASWRLVRQRFPSDTSSALFLLYPSMAGFVFLSAAKGMQTGYLASSFEVFCGKEMEDVSMVYLI